MAIDIKYDLIGNPEPPTIILANRNGNKLGQLYVEAESVNLIDKLNEASEIAFTMYKYIDGKINNLWDKVVNFKLIYCKEWDCWFEITVELDEETETVKTVLGTQLGQAELSQIMLYDIHVNEEGDPNWDDDNTSYKNTILYDVENSSASLLHRLLEKAPHYSIGHVDDSLINIQRSFSFDGTSIYDAFQEVAEEIGCLFVFHSDSDEHGMPRRVISVYDLQQNCNDCGHRGEFTDTCPNPKCPTNLKDQYPNYVSKGIKMGYGEDTTIFVTADELASGGIQLTTDTDAVKNCFKLEAGDDLMTATIRNRNPNGTDYIWYFSNDMKADMPDEMVEKIEKYDKLYSYYYTNTNTIPEGLDSSDIKIEKPFVLDDNLVNSYNALVEKYKDYYNSPSTCVSCGYEAIFAGDCPQCGSDNILHGDNLQLIPTSILGFASLMEAYYNTIDFGWYLKSGLMPDVTMGKTDAKEQGLLLEISLPPLIAVANLSIISDTTTDNYVLQMARAIVNSAYKVSIKSSELTGVNWKGNFVIENYSDEEDTYTTAIISRTLTDFDETYIKQKVDKILSKENTDNLSVTGLFEKDYDEFCAELKKYALVPLTSFHSACQACIDILIEQGVGESESWGKTETGAEGNLHEKLYVPYYNKLKAIEAEMKVRENELTIILGVYDEKTEELKIEGMQTNIESLKNDIQKELNFQDYFGEDLWKQFCAYRREDKYSNSNYISDGLNNAELFERALEFYEVAENEIFKSSELQHSISATLNNLLAIPKFKSLVKFFKVGNWIRVQIDDFVYKLRLVEYEIDYGKFDNISVKFSDVTKIKSGISDLESILSDASSMASSYDSIKRQANLGNEAQNKIRQWLDEGLDASLYRIKNNVNEKMVIDNNGLIGRSYNEVTEEYSPEQIRLTHNIMAYTDDDWASVKMAIGKHTYNYYDEGEKDFIEAEGYGVSADFVTAGIVSGSQIIGGNIYSSNYSPTLGTGSYINLITGDFSFGGGALKFDTESGELSISLSDASTVEQITKITKDTVTTSYVEALKITVDAANVNGKLTAANIDAGSVNAGELTGMTINGGQLLIGNKDNTYAEITSAGVLNCNGANITGHINATSGTFSGDIAIGETYNENNEVTGHNFVVDSSGNVTMNGGITLGGNITWSTPPIKYQYSSNNITWHDTYQDGDIYRKESYDGGTTWTDSYQFIGEDGSNAEIPDYIEMDGIDFTSISNNYIKSPKIYGGEFYGNEFNIISDTSGGSLNLYGNTGDDTYHLFTITHNYEWVNIYSPASAPINISGTISFSGNVSFNSATVDGLTAVFG